MTKYLNPIKVVEQPRQDFIRYLLTAYPLKDPELRNKFALALQQPGIIWQHPYLEGSQPYETGESIKTLASQNLLHPGMTDLFAQNERLLYKHQQDAIQSVIEEQQNIVVATGTGSGKTECFLIPMMDNLLKEGAGLLNYGVRVLILYPMNALVNDQVKRLRLLLCRQNHNLPLIRFGFYTSRTETEEQEAVESLTAELQAYEAKELQEFFTDSDRATLNLSTHENLVHHAVEKIREIQALSRRETWNHPPHILVTNYSMLEHMLIRPLERTRVFEASKETFKMLVVDEAHSYNGSTGLEVSMLLKRLKVAAVEKPKGKICCIATSASLGGEEVNPEVLKFAQELFDEPFSKVIRGKRVEAYQRLGNPYDLSPDLTDEEVLDYLSILKLPEPNDPLEQWVNELGYIVPAQQLVEAQEQSQGDVHKLLWFALWQHPVIHRLIDLLRSAPQPWEQVTQSPQLWGFALPTALDGGLDKKAVENAKQALAHLLQLGTLARKNPEDLPLLPVRLHLLFRSVEGLYTCINWKCRSLYLSEKQVCEKCEAPVLELGSCSQCGQAYVFTQLGGAGELQPLPRTNEAIKRDAKRIYTLTLDPIGNVTEEDEENEEEGTSNEPESNSPTTFTILRNRDGWIGRPSHDSFTLKPRVEGEFRLPWHRHKGDKGLDGCYLLKCAACGARPNRSQAINRFVAYTDGPLEAMVDSLFELLPESRQKRTGVSERKLLAFSDGRQDAAFFASDYQRTHTEMLYRQMIWQAFQEVKDNGGVASVNQITDKLRDKFLEISIPHPDRDSMLNYLSYVPEDEAQVNQNRRDCQNRAESRAKELLLREFALPFARRSSLEAFGTLACHVELEDDGLIGRVAEKFHISPMEAKIFLTGLMDIIRRTGIVSIGGASRYFPETGGVDGGRPEMVDTQGRSKNYLFLKEKSEDEKKKYKDSPCGLPKFKEGKVSKEGLNRLRWYYLKLFGEEQFPQKEDFIWLFEQLKSSGLLVPAQKEYHLNWNLVNIIQASRDWYQCNCCQQIIHVPGLAEVSHQPTLTLNVSGCPAFRCRGILEPYTPERILQATNEHYQQYLIRERLPLPLRSQEHTAQLSTEELAKRENRFRRGQINLLSCSTTLEMGVDIGELQAVVLRNFPPHVSNYQQRAGRAGRRTDGVAVTLMYGQRRPHDRFFFEQPERLIAGTNQIPKLDSGNWQIRQRHIRAELLSAFLDTRKVGAEKVEIFQFFQLPTNDPAAFPNFTPPADAMVSELLLWLNSDSALTLAQLWVEQLQGFGTAQDILAKFREEIADFQQKQLKDWNDLVSLLIEILDDIDAAKTDRSKRKSLEKRRDGLEAELEKIASRQLHEELVRASILPIYGFPIDVARLLTGESNRYKSSQGRHRLERDRRMALSEYAPNQDIVVDDRVYRSVGILRPRDLEEKHYWVCKNCNHFLPRSKSDEGVDECPVCRWEPQPPIARKVNTYKVPRAFITDSAEPPKVTPYIKPVRQPVSQVFLLNPGEQKDASRSLENVCRLTISQNGEFFLANQGSRGIQGFAICQTCGLDLSDEVRKEREKARKGKRSKKTTTASESSPYKHHQPLTGKPCLGHWNEIHLGHEFRSDFVTIEFDEATKPLPLFGEPSHSLDSDVDTSVTDSPDRQVSFWRSLTYALLAAAAEVIDVRREELDGLFSPQPIGKAKIIIYDNVPGGAGHSRRIADEFRDVLVKAYELIEFCCCDSSCYDCLRTYSNQLFHAQLDRRLISEFLQRIVETLAPDQKLQDYGPGAHRISLSAIADSLPTFFRTARPTSIIYLPQLTDTFDLNRGTPLSWLNLLEDAVISMKSLGMPLELIVNQLPDLSSDANRVLRKRLHQWIDLEQLRLYKTTLNTLPILCLSSQQQNPIALELELRQSSDSQKLKWIQIRSQEGVERILQRLCEVRSQSTPIDASTLDDPDTSAIFPDPSWVRLSLAELRTKLGLERVFQGSTVKKVTYCDRYLYGKGARILADLLQGEWLDSSATVKIDVLEKERQFEPRRKAELEAAFTSVKAAVSLFQVKVSSLKSYPNFPHGRVLEIQRKDGQKYKIIFDKGIDLLKVESGGVYSVTEPTYVVVIRQD